MASQIYFYTRTPIIPSGSGTNIRQYSNVRAYLDLDLPVKVIHIAPTSTDDTVILPVGADYVPLVVQVTPPRWTERLAYKIGFPFGLTLSVLYPDRQSILGAVLENESATPGAIHHFEYPSTANVSISLGGKGLNLVWSCHDWESDRNRKITVMREEAGRQKTALEKMRRLYYARQVEKRIARACGLVLMIAEHETRIFREELGIHNAELLPTSWPDENVPAHTRAWAEGGALRLLHLGSPDAMVGYYSLKFILSEVFPCLPESIRDCIELWVAGKMGDTEYAHRVRQLATPYPQVKFLGFVDDLSALYAQSDIQLVGNAAATGLRTRIVESFLYGLPVLSVPSAADGVRGLDVGRNILLADSPEAFADQICRLVEDPSPLAGLAVAGRALYNRLYARQVTAATLKGLLNRYFAHIQR
ncbi:MAG: glycosyltransferase [Chloroflexota bacterium]